MRREDVGKFEVVQRAQSKELDRLTKVAQVHHDAWINVATGLGISTMDKAVSSYFISDAPLSYEELSALYHFSALCRKIVRLRPEEMFRVGYDVTVGEKPDPSGPDGKDPKGKDKGGQAKQAKPKPKPGFKKDLAAEQEGSKGPQDPEMQLQPEAGEAEPPYEEDDDPAEKLEKMAKALALDVKMLDAMCLGRAYGGAILFVGADDGQDPSLPLNDKEPGEIRFLTVFDRRECITHKFYTDPLSPRFGEPEQYILYPQFHLNEAGQKVVSGKIVHESRCIRFEGAPADRRERLKLWGWTHSVLQSVYSAVRDFEGLFRSMSYMVQDANQSVFKLSGLIDQIATGQETLRARMQFTENTRAVNRAVLLDADENEDFIKTATTFQGIPDVFDRFLQRLSTDVDIPAMLLGQPAAGMQATGESELILFYNSVARDQENVLKPGLQRVYGMLAKSIGVDPSEVHIECRPLVDMTEKERSALELEHAQKDKLYIDAGVLTPEEVTLSRFRDHREFGLRIKLSQESLDARHESLEMALEEPDFSGTNEPEIDGAPPGSGPTPPGSAVLPGSANPRQAGSGRVPAGSNGGNKPRANTKGPGRSTGQ